MHPGETKDEVWKQLHLPTQNLGNDTDDDWVPDRYRLSWNYAIKFTFAETTNSFTVEKDANGKIFLKDNRKLIQAVLYKNGLEVCRSKK